MPKRTAARTPARRPARKPAPAARRPAARTPAASPGAAAALAKVRALCLAFPEATERPSHGAPTFFVGKRSFATFADNHHGDGKLAVVVAAPAGFQAMIVETSPAAYYLPAYVARLGWVGVRLDRDTPWSEIAAVLEQAYVAVAPAALAAALRAS